MRQEEFRKLPRTIDEVNDWRHRPANRYTTDDGRALVSRVKVEGEDLKPAVRRAVDLIGGVRKALQPGDRVLLKANFNSDDPFPASTDLPFLAAVVDLLREEGITDLTLGERSGWPWMPTSKVLKAMGVYQYAEEARLPVVDFDGGPWMEVRTGPEARCWSKIAFHKSLLGFDKIVYLPCMKHHFLAGFTMSLKLTVGLTHPLEMAYMHADYDFGKSDEPMYLKMIELSTVVGPDLIIMDGRKSFVTGGPDRGELVEPGVLMASGDRVAIDVEGIKALQTYPRDNQLQMPVWEIPTIRRAIELGLGSGSEDGYAVVDG